MGFVSYDDERAICDKTEYVIDRSLNGYIIWEISGDLMPDLSTPLLDATNNRLNKLDVRCEPVQVATFRPTQTPTGFPSTNGGQTTMVTPGPTEKITSGPTMQPSTPTRTSSPTNNDASTIIIPKDEDILFGRGSKARHNFGNIRLRGLVNQYRPSYLRKYP